MISTTTKTETGVRKTEPANKSIDEKMNAGKASKKIAIWGSIIALVAMAGFLGYALIVHRSIPSYEELPAPLMILSAILGLVIFAAPGLSILLGIFGLFGKEKKSATFGILYSIGFVSIFSFLSWYGGRDRGTHADVSTDADSVTLSEFPENPHMFVSETYGFGIVFPNGNPDEINAEGMGTQGVRYQFLDEMAENPIVYSITAIKGPGVPDGSSVIHLLDATADTWMEIDQAVDFKETKKFVKWGDRDVLFYDSHFPQGEDRFPKRSMLLMRESDGVMFIVSVVSGVRNDLDEKLQNFASTLVLLN